MADPSPMRRIAQQLLAGEVDEQQFLRAVAGSTFAPLTHSNLDLDRNRRAGYPEVIFAEGKSVDAVVQLAARLRDAEQAVLVTRTSPEQAAALLESDPNLIYSVAGRTVRSPNTDETAGRVAVVTGGTGDYPVAMEAIETLQWMSVATDFVADVGVAGPHRLPAHLDTLERAQAVVVVAGMEGALPSVVAGYLSVPIIAVPTSIGYGASLGGVASLLCMLNSCAANVSVVNIDAGFKAGYVSGMIAQPSKSRDLHLKDA